MKCNYTLILSFEDKEVSMDDFINFLEEIGNIRQKYDFIKEITIGVE